MTLLACGINHKSAPIAIRERLAVSPEKHADYLRAALKHSAIDEVAILSTCNRTELYCSTNDVSEVLKWLRARHNVHGISLQDHIYLYHEQAAVKHMMRVACGLDSMVLGEPQILGQIKQAYQTAVEHESLGGQLGALFRAVFSATKRVRSSTQIGHHPVSVAYAGARLVQGIFDDISKLRVLLMGAGETIELTARHLADLGIQEFIIANRTLRKAEELADRFQGRAIVFKDVPEQLSSVDVIISATASQLPILGKGTIETAFRDRKHAPLCLIDLAVPRDIEPEVAQLPDVFLYNIDDLESITHSNLQERLDAAKQAEDIIDTEVNRYLRWRRSLKAVDTIRHYRGSLDDIIEAEKHRAKRQLDKGLSAEAVLDEFSHRVKQKVLHKPTKHLRKAGYDGEEEMIHLVQKLFSEPTA